MFARVNSVQTAADKLAGLLTWIEDRLPAAREAPGFRGFYLLADRQSGKVVSSPCGTAKTGGSSKPEATRYVRRRVRSWALPPLLLTFMR